MADKTKVGVQFSAVDLARIDRFGAGSDIRDPSRAAVVRTLALRALDAIEEEEQRTAKGGGRRKGRAS